MEITRSNTSLEVSVNRRLKAMQQVLNWAILTAGLSAVLAVLAGGMVAHDRYREYQLREAADEAFAKWQQDYAADKKERLVRDAKWDADRNAAQKRIRDQIMGQ